MPATATAPKKKSASSQKVTLQPLGDKVVVEREESSEKTKGGIYIPDAAKDKPTRGTIIAVGTGKLLDDGSRGPMQVKKGDRVLFTSYAPEVIKIGEDEFLLMSETDILAVIE
jgi:chaperonin GroES